MNLKIKSTLYTICLEDLNKRRLAIKERLEALQSSKTNETKSSVGDKYETGRAMLQIEENNCQLQLAEIIKTQELLSNINPSKSNTIIENGSLVETDKATYFISIGLGKVKIPDYPKPIFCISINAPILSVLKNKKIGDTVTFNNRMILIKNIV